MHDTLSNAPFLGVTIWKCPCSSVIAPCTKAESGNDNITTLTKGIGSPFSSTTVPPTSGVLAIDTMVIINTVIKTANLKLIFFIFVIFIIVDYSFTLTPPRKLLAVM